MVRAARCGAVDFDQFDPRNPRHWRRLHWLCDELEREELQAICTTRVNWAAGRAGVYGITEESLQARYEEGVRLLQDIMQLARPWDKPSDSQTQLLDAVSAYHQVYGQPGEERFEQMVTALSEALSRGPLTEEQKEVDRRRRRARQRTEAES